MSAKNIQNLGIKLFFVLLFMPIYGIAGNTTVIKGTSSISHILCTPSGTYFNTNLNLREYVNVNSNYDNYAFLRINVSEVPAGAVITDVRLKLYYLGTWGYGTSNVYVGNTDHYFYSTLTWNTYDGSNSWPSGAADGIDGYTHSWPGAPGGPLATLSCDPATINNWKTFSSEDLLTHVQTLVANGQDAFLWMAHDGANGYQRFATNSNSGYEPSMEVDWYMPVPEKLLLVEGHNDTNHQSFLDIVPELTIISGTTTNYTWINELRDQGKIFAVHVINQPGATASELVAEWRKPFDDTNVPFGFDAIIIDELHSTSYDGTDEADNVCTALEELRTLYPDKQIYFYSVWRVADGGPGSLYGDPSIYYSEVLNAINDYASGFLLESYHREGNQQLNLFAAFADNISLYASGILNKTIFVLYIAQNGFIADDSATVGFWGFLDEQFHRIKNDPDASVMPGVGAWVYYRSEPETPEFFAKLIDHYYIQDNNTYFGDGNMNNLISNPQFDPSGATTGWTLTPGSGGQISTINYSNEGVLDNHGYVSYIGQSVSHGDYGLRMISGTTANKTSYSVYGVDTGMTYTVSAWVLSDVTGAKAKLQITDSSNNIIAYESIDITKTSDYTRIQFNFTPTATDIKVILSDDGSTQSTRLYWDFIELEEAYEN